MGVKRQKDPEGEKKPSAKEQLREFEEKNAARRAELKSRQEAHKEKRAAS